MMFVYDSLGQIAKTRIDQQEFPSRLIEIYTNLVAICYLINIRKYTDEEAFNPIRHWLNRCNELRRVQFNGVYLIKYNINSAKRNAYLPRTLLKSGYIGYFISSWIMSEKFSLTQMCGAPDYKHSLK